jgi:tRNA 2-thiouridine synthesizing protein B
MEDGVFGGLLSAPCAEELSEKVLAGIEVYALAADVNARGLQEKIRDDILIIDYNGFVQLSIKHNCVQSWY